MEVAEIRKKLKKALDKDRYEHTKGVMYTAGCMAMAYGYDMNKAMLAGLLHDCAKCIANTEKLDLCEEHHILVSTVEHDNPGLLHAKLGAVLAEEIYKVTDPDILHAIKVHTTGEDRCVAEILYDTLHFLNSKKGAIDPTTQLTYEYYKQFREEI